MKFSIIFPVMNQEDHIEDVIRSYHKILSKHKLSFELIAIVNGTTDNSFAICKRLTKKLQHVSTYELKNSGYGLGILYGIKHSQGKYICYLNCARIKAQDLIASIKLFLKNQNSVIHGVRMHRDTIFWRQFGSKIYNKYCQLLFQTHTRDINGNPNVFSRKNFRKLHLTYTDSMIDLQLLDNAKQCKIPIIEIPITDYSRHGGTSTSNFKTIFRLIYEVFKYWKNTRLNIKM